jgi:3-deoxy-D-manno-octulosonate 8-phosphate phosphatase (KDO 8-P phosphatase)
MGDDLVDYEPMSKVGIPVCPKDAVNEIKSISVYVSPIEGGKGCVRDVIEQVMKVSGKWLFPSNS